jgi:hypothetical protein
LTWADLDALVEKPAALWINGDSTYHGTNDRVNQAFAAQLSSSLFLTRPDNLTVHVQTEGGMFGNPRRRVRADFTHHGTRYNAIVTDPLAEQAFLARENGVYPVNSAYLCVSLTEVYEGDGCCHKLVAAIITEQQL